MKKGFTLIELLVVVLIIGIISAIALPRYLAAVEKSRTSEALVVAKAILDAEQRYKQANPEDGSCVSSRYDIADVDLKGGVWSSESEYDTKTFRYNLTTLCSDGYITVTREDGTISGNSYSSAGGRLYSVKFYTEDSGHSPKIDCTPASSADEDSETICRFFENL